MLLNLAKAGNLKRLVVHRSWRVLICLSQMGVFVQQSRLALWRNGLMRCQVHCCVLAYLAPVFFLNRLRLVLVDFLVIVLCCEVRAGRKRIATADLYQNRFLWFISLVYFQECSRLLRVSLLCFINFFLIDTANRF